MSRFDWFESGAGIAGVELGIVRPDIYMKYIRFKVYLDFLERHDKKMAIELTAERNKCEITTIYRAIDFFAST